MIFVRSVDRGEHGRKSRDSPHFNGREHHSIAKVDVEFENACLGTGVAMNLDVSTCSPGDVLGGLDW